MCDELRKVIASDVKEVVGMHVDNFKLSLVEGLASVTGSAIAIVICMFLVNLALVLFTFAFIYLLDMLIDSLVWSAVILGVVYLAVGLFVLLRPGAFKNRMVRVFAPMIFSTRKDYEDE